MELKFTEKCDHMITMGSEDGVKEVKKFLNTYYLGGGALFINGQILPSAAIELFCRVRDSYIIVAIYDPSIVGYVVAISHHPTINVGDVIPNI